MARGLGPASPHLLCPDRGGHPLLTALVKYQPATWSLRTHPPSCPNTGSHSRDQPAARSPRSRGLCLSRQVGDTLQHIWAQAAL